MKRAPAALALMAFLVCDQAARADQPVSACRTVIFESAPLTDCTADPAKDRIRIVVQPAGGDPYRSLAAFAAARLLAGAARPGAGAAGRLRRADALGRRTHVAKIGRAHV